MEKIQDSLFWNWLLDLVSKIEIENTWPKSKYICKIINYFFFLFSSLQNAVLTQYSNLKVPSWEQLSEGARNTISVITKNVGLGVPYGIVFALFGAILYATFVVVSTGITMKMNLLDLGTEFLRTNMPIFTGGEIEGGDLLSSRMMTETLLPMVYQAFDKFGAVDTAEEETNE